MTTPLFVLLWPQLTTQYTPTPIFTTDGGNKAWRTNLGDSSLGWT
ncbi:BgtTE-56050 [Blumeria graminis f. sp. tritici]|uniref:BgtTE-56050 n=1 Tax=Blumeria graminis f. sp. tritici TaxID=62690 RepID=A0A9X9MFG3_BLUGR|nr:BgtTE-56050 [Blumeria graminis f. sp. tritici]